MSASNNIAHRKQGIAGSGLFRRIGGPEKNPSCPNESSESTSSSPLPQHTSAQNSNSNGNSNDNSNYPFPYLLYKILERTERNGESSIAEVISWLPDGRSFMVHDVDRFVVETLPHFSMNSMRVFLQRLYQCKFQVDNKTGAVASLRRRRSPTLCAAGPFYHKNFRRGQPNLLRGMLTVDAIQAILSQKLSRAATKKRRWSSSESFSSSSSSSSSSASGSSSTEPRFLSMPPIRLLKHHHNDPGTNDTVTNIFTEVRLQSTPLETSLSSTTMTDRPFHRATREINQEMSSLNIFMRDAYYQVSA